MKGGQKEVLYQLVPPTEHFEFNLFKTLMACNVILEVNDLKTSWSQRHIKNSSILFLPEI